VQHARMGVLGVDDDDIDAAVAAVGRL
jgi:hypothetical protein